MKLKKLLLLIFILSNLSLLAQNENFEKDSLYILQIENIKKPFKVLHAEPLFIDLIRDLGARKGEKEWNIGMGLTDNLKYDTHEALVEYEWAPIDRLGLEVELPFTFYAPTSEDEKDSLPSNRLNSLKVALQYTFLVNEENSLSMAVGYINEFELSGFNQFGNPLINGNVYNPFFIIAKRWGRNFHSLLYSGPKIFHNFGNDRLENNFEINTSFHYMVSGTRNFIGLEFNKEVLSNNFDMTIRPQMRVEITKQVLIGIVAGIPISRENQRLSSFIRLIWEPKHKQTKQ